MTFDWLIRATKKHSHDPLRKEIFVGKYSILGVSAAALLGTFCAAQAGSDLGAVPAPQKAANSRIMHVTVYQNSALVTREVDVPEGQGTMEIVVTPLPPQTVNSSLYSEGTDGLRVLTTRFRMRPIKEDTREEVRKLEAKLRTQRDSVQKLQGEIKTVELNL